MLAHPLADPEKGSGIAMICTFGDTTDVTWWRELSLPTRTIVGPQRAAATRPVGRQGWPSHDPRAAERAYGELEGRTVTQARTRIVEMLTEAGALIGEPATDPPSGQVLRAGRRPLEIVSSRQWYVRTLAYRERLLERGRELHWHPAHMLHRYEAWVEGLNGDWNISRQRFFGVPFPVWYPVEATGARSTTTTRSSPSESGFPSTRHPTSPPGMAETAGRNPAVSSATRRHGHLGDLLAHSRDRRPVGGRPRPLLPGLPDGSPAPGHEIIRTWLFSHGRADRAGAHELPWTDTAISGWVLDPEPQEDVEVRAATSSTPTDLLESHGADAVRYWAASGRPGVDTAVDEGQMKVGAVSP